MPFIGEHVFGLVAEEEQTADYQCTASSATCPELHGNIFVITINKDIFAYVGLYNMTRRRNVRVQSPSKASALADQPP